MQILRELMKWQPMPVNGESISPRLDLDDGNYRAYLDDIGMAAAIAHDPDETALAGAAPRGWDPAATENPASVSEHQSPQLFRGNKNLMGCNRPVDLCSSEHLANRLRLWCEANHISPA